MNDHINKEILDKKKIQQIISYLQEFLSCYVVIGYDHDKQPVTLLSTLNQQDEDALASAIQRFKINDELEEIVD